MAKAKKKSTSKRRPITAFHGFLKNVKTGKVGRLATKAEAAAAKRAKSGTIVIGSTPFTVCQKPE